MSTAVDEAITEAPPSARTTEPGPLAPPSAPSDSGSGASPAGWKRALSMLALDTRAATIAYWTGVTLVSLAVFIPRLLPCTDYPQHLALADVARRLLDPHAPEHAEYSINYFTYNGLFHVLVAQLSRLVPIEIAGKIVVSLGLSSLGAAVLLLLRALRRPLAYAALFTPILFSFALGWGFVNYALGTAIAVLCLASVAWSLRKPTRRNMIATGVLALVCAMTHVMATLLLCLLALALAPETAWRAFEDERSIGRRAWRAIVRIIVALSPILAGAAWCIGVYKVQYAWDPSMYKDATLEGSSPPLWQKVAYFGAWATGLHTDFWDQVILGVAMIVVVAAIVLHVVDRRRRDRDRDRDRSGDRDRDRVFVLPFLVAFAAYLLLPMVFIGTHLIFPRLAQGVILGALLLAPRFPERMRAAATRIALGTGVLAGISLVAHSIAFAAETNDASRVIDDAPPGRSATAVVYGSETFSFRNGTLVHLAAYYAARKHGDWAFSFARYLSVPVRYVASGAPPWPKLGWEFGPMDYNPRCKYARRFDLVFVKAPSDFSTDDSEESRVRALVFHQDAGAVTLVSHHGHYWAFDTRGLPDDGTF